MRTFALSATLLFLILGTPRLSHAQDTGHCPYEAVFLALQDQVRGYPARANGLTKPCQVLKGPKTNFTEASAITISKHGDLHVVQFYPYNLVEVFRPESHGDVAPEHLRNLCAIDLLAMATDSEIHDFVITNDPSALALMVADAPCYTLFNIGGPLAEGSGLAVDHDDNLVMGGYDFNNDALIVTYNTTANLYTPSILRQISGPKTGLLPLVGPCCDNNTLSVAVDPDNGELYVYTYSNGRRQISVFSHHASGDVKPIRIIAGPHTLIGPPQ